jgi:H+/Cl- antiporter ClcA
MNPHQFTIAVAIGSVARYLVGIGSGRLFGLAASQRAPEKSRAMTGIPNSSVMALWVTASFWAVFLVAYLVGGPSDLVFPLLPFGMLTGTAAWSLGSTER